MLTSSAGPGTPSGFQLLASCQERVPAPPSQVFVTPRAPVQQTRVAAKHARTKVRRSDVIVPYLLDDLCRHPPEWDGSTGPNTSPTGARRAAAHAPSSLTCEKQRLGRGTESAFPTQGGPIAPCGSARRRQPGHQGAVAADEPAEPVHGAGRAGRDRLVVQEPLDVTG